MGLDKNRKYKILTCCGIGQGTCVLLAKVVKKVFAELGIEVTVDTTQVGAGASLGKSYDAIFCNRNLVGNFDEAAKQGCKIIGLKNIMSTQEAKEKLLEAFGNE